MDDGSIDGIGELLELALSIADKRDGEHFVIRIVKAMRISGWGFAYRGSPGSNDIDLVLSKTNGPGPVSVVPLVRLDKKILFNLICETGLIGTVRAEPVAENPTCINDNERHCPCYTGGVCCLCDYSSKE